MIARRWLAPAKDWAGGALMPQYRISDTACQARISDIACGMATRKQTPAAVAAKQRYEAAKKRPGSPISARFSDAELKAIDVAREDMSRAAWLKMVALKAARLNR
jgi:hypothetical protein